MSRYLLIESKDPIETRSSEDFLGLAGSIAAKGDSVILFLVQNGVLPLRKGSIFNPKIRELIEARVKILADRFSLIERAIQERDRLGGIVVCEIDRAVETLMEPETKTIWH
jgi:predicted peroxiredoxin